MAHIHLKRAGVDFPLFFAGDRSFKRNLIGSAAASGKRTNIRALDDIDLSVEPGARLALLGGNAAGKTTLLRVMGDLLTPSSGQVEIRGRAVSLLGTGIGIDLSFTARQTIIGQGLLMGFALPECKARLGRAIAFGDLDDILDMPLNTLGQGHQIRVGLGMAAAYQAEILLIDEMLEHLAPAFIDRLCDFIRSGMPSGAIVVIAERSKSLLERVCGEAILLHEGKLIEQGPLAKMTQRHGRHLTP